MLAFVTLGAVVMLAIALRALAIAFRAVVVVA